MDADKVRALFGHLRDWAREQLDPPSRELLAALLAPGIATFCPRPESDGLTDWLPLPERVAAVAGAPRVGGLVGGKGG